MVQVDNYIYTGEGEAMSKFEEFLTQRFRVGEKLRENYTVYGAQVNRTGDGTIKISQTNQLEQLSTYTLAASRAALLHEKANCAERTAFLSIIGFMLFIGALTMPPMLCHASYAAKHTADLRVSHLVQLNKVVTVFKSQCPVVTFMRPKNISAQLLTCADASHGRQDETHANIGYIIFMYFPGDNVTHSISFASHKSKWVSRSTLAAEALAAADAFDASFFVAKIHPLGISPIHLATDSRTLYSFLTKTNNPKERRLKLDIFALREAYERGELKHISWLPAHSQLADELTKPKRPTPAGLVGVLQTGKIDFQKQFLQKEKPPCVDV